MIERNQNLINILRSHIDTLETNLSLFNAILKDKTISNRFLQDYYNNTSTSIKTVIGLLRELEYNIHRAYSIELNKRELNNSPYDLDPETYTIFVLDENNNPKLNLKAVKDVQILNALFDYEKYRDFLKEAELCTKTENP